MNEYLSEARARMREAIAAPVGSTIMMSKADALAIYNATSDQEPAEVLASKLIDAWAEAHGKPVPWDKAVQIVAIIQRLPSVESNRLLALGEA